MPGDLYQPEDHHKKETPMASTAGRGLKKLFWYVLTLVLGAAGIKIFLAFLVAIGNGTFENATAEGQGEVFGTVIGGVIALFLAFKCLGKARDVF